MPCGTNAPRNRVGTICFCTASALRDGSIDSSSGTASVVPSPRRNVRRGNRRLVRKNTLGLLQLPPVTAPVAGMVVSVVPVGVLVDAAAATTFMRNRSLIAMASIRLLNR